MNRGFFTFICPGLTLPQSLLLQKYPLGDPHLSSASTNITLQAWGHLSYTHKSHPFWPAHPITQCGHSGPSLALSDLMGFTIPVAGLLAIEESASFSLWLLASKGFSLKEVLPAFLSLQAMEALLLKGSRFCLLPILLPITRQGFCCTFLHVFHPCMYKNPMPM